MEISRGSVKMEKFGEVLWSSACDYIETKRGNFVLDSNHPELPTVEICTGALKNIANTKHLK